MRTLFVTVDPAWPPVSGADLRNWQNAVAARALGPVAIASLAAGGNAAPNHDIGSVALTNIDPRDIWRRTQPTPTRELAAPPDAETRLADAVRDFSPDVVVFEYIGLHPLFSAVRRSGTRIILDLHNVESAMAARLARDHLPLRPGRWRAARKTALAFAALEQRLASETSAVWVCSADESAAFARAVRRASPVHIVPNGIPRPECAPGTLHPSRARNGDGFRLVFAGHLAYPPNVKAAQWLATGILPAARRRHPELTLVLAGRSPSSAVRSLATMPLISVEADPGNLDEILTGSDVAVLPIRAGGGTRFKAIEAMSRGLPLIATRFAVEGLGLIENVHFRPAETTRQFARAVAELAVDSATYARLRGAAWRHCLQNFSPGVVARAVHRGLSGP